MLGYLKTWLALIRDRRGATAVDYGVILGVMAVALAVELAEKVLGAK